MDEYQVSEMDLTVLAEDDYDSAYFDIGTKNTVAPVAVLSVACADLNDCQVRYARINGKLNMKFSGMKADSICAVELMKYLYWEMYRQAERFAVGRADRHAYRAGFAKGIRLQVDEVLRERRSLKISNGTALVACKQKLVTEHFGKVKYGSRKAEMKGSNFAYSSGFRKGTTTSLNRQVSKSQPANIA
jgi:hypothetical protein